MRAKAKRNTETGREGGRERGQVEGRGWKVEGRG